MKEDVKKLPLEQRMESARKEMEEYARKVHLQMSGAITQGEIIMRKEDDPTFEQKIRIVLEHDIIGKRFTWSRTTDDEESDCAEERCGFIVHTLEFDDEERVKLCGERGESQWLTLADAIIADAKGEIEYDDYDTERGKVVTVTTRYTLTKEGEQ